MTKKYFSLLSLLLYPLFYQPSVQASIRGFFKTFTYINILATTAAAAEIYGFKNGREFEKLPKNEQPENLLAYMAITTTEKALHKISTHLASAENHLAEVKKTLFSETLSKQNPTPTESIASAKDEKKEEFDSNALTEGQKA